MLSYRHAFHAGNHADVLKHLILLQIAEYMGEKPAPFWIIDTHAGAGRYALESAHASKLGEYRDGVGRLCDRVSIGGEERADACGQFGQIGLCCGSVGHGAFVRLSLTRMVKQSAR